MNINLESLTDWLKEKFIPVYLRVRYDDTTLRHDWDSVFITETKLEEMGSPNGAMAHMTFRFQAGSISDQKNEGNPQPFKVTETIPLEWLDLDYVELLRNYSLWILRLNQIRISREQDIIEMSSRSIKSLNKDNIRIQSILNKTP